MEALRARIKGLEAKPRGLVRSAFTVTLGDPISKKRPKYPLPEPFDRDPRKLQLFLTAIKGYYLKYDIRDKEE